MSDSHGKVKFKDGTVLCSYYSGTSDIMSPSLHDTISEVWENHNWDKCSCIGEDVEIYCDYGGGKTYSGRACKEHRCITFDFNNYKECYVEPEYRWNSNLSKDEENEIKKEHELIIKSNWMKRGR